MKRKDIYDKCVDFLTKNPGFIIEAWQSAGHGRGHKKEGWQLFKYCTENGKRKYGCGCLTQVRNSGWAKAQTKELTLMIQKDERLPTCPIDIKPEHLNVFAEWQRKMDRYFRRRKNERSEQSKRSKKTS